MKWLLALLLSTTLAQAQQVCDLSIGPCTLLQAVGPPGPAGSGGGNMLPGGRLTLMSGKPVMDADATSPTLWYAPYISDTYPVFNGTAWQTITFSFSPTDQVGASMVGNSKWTVGQHDVFGTISGAICTGPAWPGSDLPSRNLIRRNGILVNTLSFICDTSGTTTFACPQYQCTYLGSINPSVVGQLTATFSYGQDRKFEAWNAYNQVDIVLHVGANNVGYMPTNQYPTFAYFNSSALNRGIFFSGLPTNLDVGYFQAMFINSGSGPSGLLHAVCLNGLTNVGVWGGASSDTNTVAGGAKNEAHYNASAVVGQNTLAMCVAKANAATSTIWGGTSAYAPNLEVNGVMYVSYKG